VKRPRPPAAEEEEHGGPRNRPEPAPASVEAAYSDPAGAGFGGPFGGFAAEGTGAEPHSLDSFVIGELSQLGLVDTRHLKLRPVLPKAKAGDVGSDVGSDRPTSTSSSTPAAASAAAAARASDAANMPPPWSSSASASAAGDGGGGGGGGGGHGGGKGEGDGAAAQAAVRGWSLEQEVPSSLEYDESGADIRRLQTELWKLVRHNNATLATMRHVTGDQLSQAPLLRRRASQQRELEEKYLKMQKKLQVGGWAGGDCYGLCSLWSCSCS